MKLFFQKWIWYILTCSHLLRNVIHKICDPLSLCYENSWVFLKTIIKWCVTEKKLWCKRRNMHDVSLPSLTSIKLSFSPEFKCVQLFKKSCCVTSRHNGFAHSISLLMWDENVFLLVLVYGLLCLLFYKVVKFLCTVHVPQGWFSMCGWFIVQTCKPGRPLHFNYRQRISIETAGNCIFIYNHYLVIAYQSW